MSAGTVRTNALNTDYPCFRAMVPNLGSPDVLGLKLPEAFATRCAVLDFWKL